MPQVNIPIPVETIVEEEEQPSLTYKLDIENKRIFGKVDGIKAVNQAIRKAILTPRFKCLIYDNQYGSEIEDAIIAKDASWEYMEASVEGFAKDALKPDTRILEIYDFALEQEEDGLKVSFRVDTIFGETEIEEVI